MYLRYPGVNASSITFLCSFGFKEGWMWGHRLDCQCAVCQSLFRLFQLIRNESKYSGFVAYLGNRLCQLEEELAGAVATAHGSLPTPNPATGATGIAAPGVPQLIPEGLGYFSAVPPHQTVHPPEPPRVIIPAAAPPPKAPRPPQPEPKAEPLPLQLGVKQLAASPPPSLAGGTSVKVEPDESPASRKGPVVDVASHSHQEEKRERKEHKKKRDKKEKKRRSRSQSQRKRARREDTKSKSQSPEKGDCTEQASPSVKAEAAESKGEESSPKRRERRSSGRGDRRSPEPASSSRRRREASRSPSLRSRGERVKRGPRTPSREPPHRGRVQERGKGWRGAIPYSDHPRWRQSKNKGIVKRAKQELYNRQKKGKGKGKDRGGRRDDRRDGR